MGKLEDLEYRIDRLTAVRAHQEQLEELLTTKDDPFNYFGIRTDEAASSYMSKVRKLLFKCHPDKNRNKSAEEQERLQAEFLRVGKLRDILADETQRFDFVNNVSNLIVNNKWIDIIPQQDLRDRVLNEVPNTKALPALRESLTKVICESSRRSKTLLSRMTAELAELRKTEVRPARVKTKYDGDPFAKRAAEAYIEKRFGSGKNSSTTTPAARPPPPPRPVPRSKPVVEKGTGNQKDSRVLRVSDSTITESNRHVIGDGNIVEGPLTSVVGENTIVRRSAFATRVTGCNTTISAPFCLVFGEQTRLMESSFCCVVICASESLVSNKGKGNHIYKSATDAEKDGKLTRNDAEQFVIDFEGLAKAYVRAGITTALNTARTASNPALSITRRQLFAAYLETNPAIAVVYPRMRTWSQIRKKKTKAKETPNSVGKASPVIGSVASASNPTAAAPPTNKRKANEVVGDVFTNAGLTLATSTETRKRYKGVAISPVRQTPAIIGDIGSASSYGGRSGGSVGVQRPRQHTTTFRDPFADLLRKR